MDNVYKSTLNVKCKHQLITLKWYYCLTPHRFGERRALSASM